jgi:hypothetical protein
MPISPLPDQRAPQAWDAAWTEALEALEIDVTEAESLLAVSRATTEHPLAPVTGGWQPPALEGPAPGNLRARMEAILARQLRVSEELARGMAVTRQELRLVQRMDSGVQDRSVPAFVDTKF